MKINKIIVPPIKSQGIKTKLVPWIMDIVKIANPKGKWIEPFFGTGVVGFNSGFKEAILNDINPHIIQFYRLVQSGDITPQIVKKFLEEEGTKLSKSGDEGYEYFRFVRDRFNESFNPLDLLFLSRTGFNGMMRFSKKGKWNIPFCKKPNRFAQAYVTKITNQVSNISKVICDDWIFMNKGFEEIIPLAKEGDIIYCDPPYYGRYVDYYNGWDEKDEELLFTLLKETKAKFILSTWHHNDWRENDMVKKFWSEFNIVTKDHFYHSGASIENRKTVVEALVCNFDIQKISTHNHSSSKKNSAQLQIPL
ncbi:Dam family site-specific DNA-(adenine-N6)-methyltransferase [Spirosoma terrae]|uniref:Site-specific DNA-methyltransferase (adenine-specific) n=1 Tax=Spirosoma terrae TaxID=1968276 RepID=A0A6L9L5G3_9BACT|nr:Dam family site-specific DNA-(adenine-N6)-methyltransferase [Spirosoma terrae]NDU95796.1 Dam family site-specific DNA-(adenine-N6)-methyltransferase [Spirosoma terrae]